MAPVSLAFMVQTGRGLPGEVMSGAAFQGGVQVVTSDRNERAKCPFADFSFCRI